MYDEKPAHPMMMPFRDKFIAARRKDLQKIRSKSLSLSEAESLFHDWKSYCEPYGFGYLGSLSSQALVELSGGGVSEELIVCIESYLSHHKKQISRSVK